MKALLLTTEETRTIQHMQEAFEESGVKGATSLSFKSVSLLAENGREDVSFPISQFEKVDAVFLSAPMNLVQFAEPLLEQLYEKGIYCQVGPGSYYITSNKPLQCTTLTRNHLKTPRTYMFGEPSRVARVAARFTYPVLFKTYKGQEKTQGILIETERSLRSVAKGTKSNIDAVMVREFIESAIDEAVVIGEKVFTIRRRFRDGAVEETAKGRIHKLSTAEVDATKQAAKLCKCELATVRMSNGFILDVGPYVKYNTFNKKAGDNLFEEIAGLFKQRITEQREHSGK